MEIDVSPYLFRGLFISHGNGPHYCLINKKYENLFSELEPCGSEIIIINSINEMPDICSFSIYGPDQITSVKMLYIGDNKEKFITKLKLIL